MRTTYQGRPGVAINPNFKQQLQQLEAKLRPGEPPSIILKAKSKKPTLTRGKSDKNNSMKETDLSLPDEENTREKLPPFSPLNGTSGVLLAEEIVEEQGGCKLTMSDSMPDIRAACKKHDLNVKGTKRQLLNRLIEKLGASEVTDEILVAKTTVGTGIVIDLRNASEFPDDPNMPTTTNMYVIPPSVGVLNVDDIVLPGAKEDIATSPTSTSSLPTNLSSSPTITSSPSSSTQLFSTSAPLPSLPPVVGSSSSENMDKDLSVISNSESDKTTSEGVEIATTDEATGEKKEQLIPTTSTDSTTDVSTDISPDTTSEVPPQESVKPDAPTDVVDVPNTPLDTSAE